MIRLNFKIFLFIFYFFISSTIICSKNIELLEDYKSFINELDLDIIWNDKNSDNNIQENELYYKNSKKIKKSDWIKISGFLKLKKELTNIKVFESKKSDSIFLSSLNHVAFSKDSKFIAGSTDSGEVKVFNLENNKCIFKTADKEYKKILSLEFINNSNQIAFTSDSNKLVIYDFHKNKLIFQDTYSKHNFSPKIMKISDESKYMVVGTDIINVYENNFNNNWKNIITSLKQNRLMINCLEFLNQNNIIAGMGDSVSSDEKNFIDMINIKTREIKRFKNIEKDFSSFITSIKVNSVNQSVFIANNDGSIKGYKINNNNINDQLFFDSKHDFTSPVYCIDISNDGKYLAGGSRQGLIIIYDIINNKKYFIINNFFKYPIMNILFVPNTNYIAAISLDHKIIVFDIVEKENVLIIDDIDKRSKSGKRASITVSNNGEYIARGTDSRNLEVFKIKDFFYNKNLLVYIDKDGFNQITSIFNKYFNGLKDMDKIFFYQVDISNNKIPVYHIRIKLKNGKYMLVRTTTDIEEFNYLFDKMQYNSTSQLSINIIIADSEKELDEGTTVDGDWNSTAGILLKPKTKKAKEIAER